MDITSSVAIITGAASGMGAATAKLLAKQQARLLLIDRDQAKLAAVAEPLGAASAVVDVTNEADVQAAVAKASALGNIRVCVNCAGIAPGARIVGREGPMRLAEFKHVIDINLLGTFNMLNLVANAMTQQEPANADGERGVIINTASIAAYEGQVGQAAYSASKAGVIGMTLPAARELAKFGIRVFTIAPGLIETPMLANMPEKVHASLVEQTVFPKRLGQAEEFAQAVLHVIQNPLLNGSVIRLDGGVRLAAH